VNHPVFDEILRARLPIREDVFKRWQQEIRAIVNTPEDVQLTPALEKAMKIRAHA
jgi:hypothetical protein